MQTEPVHIHIHTSSVDDEVIARLTHLEQLVSDSNAALTNLTTAVTGISGRITEDMANLRSLLDQALASDAADATTIADLKAQAEDVFVRIEAATEQLNSIDPDSSFPVVEPPVDAPV